MVDNYVRMHMIKLIDCAWSRDLLCVKSKQPLRLIRPFKNKIDNVPGIKQSS